MRSRVSPISFAFLLATKLFLIVVLAGQYFAPAFADDDVLKSDVPKLDTTVAPPAPTPSKKTLKGSIEHHDKADADKSKHLFSSVDKKDKFHGLSAKAGEGSLNGGLNGFSIQALSGIGVIGVKFIMGLGYPPIINRVFPGTPAYEVGLRPNDIIVAVDGIPTMGLTKQEVYDMIVGTPHTPVTVSIRRNGDFQARTMNRIDFNDITDPIVRRDYLMSL